MNNEPAAPASAKALYPSAPWRLRGWGVATVQLIDVKAARQFVPSDCRVVPVAPGRTLGGLLFVSYEFGSTLVYRELAIVAALVRAGRRCAFYLARLYVDSAASLAGGREIWGVPKDLASFDVTGFGAHRTIVVRRDRRDVCRWQISRAHTKLRLSIALPALGTRADRFIFFTASMRARLGLIDVGVDLPHLSEFKALSLDRPLFAVSLEDFDVCVPRPTAVVRKGT